MNNQKRTGQTYIIRDMVILISAVVVVSTAYFVNRGWSMKPLESCIDISHQGKLETEEMTRSMSVLSDLPDDFLTLVDAGNQYMDQRGYALAAECYRRALSLQDAEDVRVDYGSCLQGMGLSVRAVEEFKRVLEDNPTHDIAIFNLGIVYFNQHQPDSARVYFENYLNLEPAGLMASEAKSFIKQLEN